ncbi:hypothetical protein [Thiocystis violacea]|uniref:hypothetical protein n=1 Tax=Thiocystis violacea TaxID=13725 RepID=UPI0019032899|nr:hypothetical protein [Thiocystis violacea]MBK1718833.1 hypothetical protein [Thiocystis violacea]
MLNTFNWLLVALLSSVLLVGCESNPFKQPAPTPLVEPGNACVSNCELMKTQCDQRQQLRERLCQEYAAQLQTEQRECRDGTGPLCVQPIECLGADMKLCSVQYDQCLMECGSERARPADPAPAEPESRPEPGKD